LPLPNREPASAATGSAARCPSKSAVKGCPLCRRWQGGGRDRHPRGTPVFSKRMPIWAACAGQLAGVMIPYWWILR
jgi:hypothetical protein